MSKLVPPHGGKGLVCSLLEGSARDAELAKAKGLKKVEISPRVRGDLIMMGTGGFSPLKGFMTKADWKSVCEKFTLSDGTFWPVPVMLDASKAEADPIAVGEEIALVYDGDIYATMKVTEKFALSADEKKWECEQIFRGAGEDSEGARFWEIAEEDHPGVKMVMSQKEFCLAGDVKVLSEGNYPDKYKGVYKRPAELRAELDKKGWSTVAALQLRNPMHRSHEYWLKLPLKFVMALSSTRLSVT